MAAEIAMDKCEISSKQQLCEASTLSRLMQPDDANPSGTVHGGTILKMIGHTGWLSATRYLNNNLKSNADHKYIAVMLRCESMDFKLPIHIGEVCTCNAKVSFTSERSIEVEVELFAPSNLYTLIPLIPLLCVLMHHQVTVIAENAISSKKRNTNSARLWFTGIRVPKMSILGVSPKHQAFTISKQDLVQIPSLKLLSPDEYEAALQRYYKQKASRNNTFQRDILNAVDLNEWTDRILNRDEMDKKRAGGTAFKLVQVTLPSDCFGTASTVVDGGYVMKMMDNVAGCCAYQWAKQRIVTVCINAINFHSPVDAGNVCHCYGRLVFTSKRSMEIFVLTFVHCDESEADEKAEGDEKAKESGKAAESDIYKMLGRYRLKLISSGYFTFVALNAENPPKSINVPQFTPRTVFERMIHSQGLLEYEERANARKQKRERQNINDSMTEKKSAMVLER